MKISKRVVLGTVVAGTLAVSSSAFAWHSYTKSLQARFAQIKLIVDGKTIQTKAEPFIYNGNVYAPIATIANALGFHQFWVNSTPAVVVKDKAYEAEENWSQAGQEEASEARYKHTVVMGDQLTLNIYDPTDVPETAVWWLTDLKNNVNVALPAITKDGYFNKQTLLTQQFVNITGSSNYEFAVEEVLRKNDIEDEEDWVSIYRYENKKVERVTSVMVDKHTNVRYDGTKSPLVSHDVPEIRFDPWRKSMSVALYDWTYTAEKVEGKDYSRYTQDKDLTSIKQYKFMDGEFKVVKELR